MKAVADEGEVLISEGHPQSEEFRAIVDDLLEKWQQLLDAVRARHDRLMLADEAQQVGIGCSEAYYRYLYFKLLNIPSC